MIAGAEVLEQEITKIATLGEGELIQRILGFKAEGRIKLDFTPEFLQRQTREGLGHILLAIITALMDRAKPE
jgi:hypothetical protein